VVRAETETLYTAPLSANTVTMAHEKCMTHNQYRRKITRSGKTIAGNETLNTRGTTAFYYTLLTVSVSSTERQNDARNSGHVIVHSYIITYMTRRQLSLSHSQPAW